MPPAKKKPVPADDPAENVPVGDSAPVVETAPVAEAAVAPEPVQIVKAPVELTPEDRVAALERAAGLKGVSPDQVDVAAARVLNRG